MNKLMIKFKGLSLGKKIQIISAVMLTLAMSIVIPVYAWFASQKKAAEMFKIQYPNALYINAAHREDQIYFDLESVDVTQLQKDSDGVVIYYSDAGCTIPAYLIDLDTNQPALDENRKHIYNKTGTYTKILSQKYVFSVFGSNTETFKLQLAYTNNNQFKYKLYPATEYTGTAPPSPDAEYVTHSDSHNISKELFPSDVSIAEGTKLYYVSGTELSGRYLNTQSGDLLAENSGTYYINNYGNTSLVQARSVPIYWQTNDDINVLNKDNNKTFYNYFVLEVTWDQSRNAEKKETDMIAITAQRTG